MAILLVTYDLNSPGQKYAKVHGYLKSFTHCKGMESVWLLDTTVSPGHVRDGLKTIVDNNDTIFVVKLNRSWSSLSYSCGEWLNDGARNW